MAGRAAVLAAAGRSPVAVRALPAELLVAVLLTTSVLLPLTFLPVVEDSFALPKFVLLGAVSVVAIICLAVQFLGRPKSGLMPAMVAVPLGAYLAFNAIAFAFSTEHGRSLFGERLQYQGFATLVLYAAAFCGGALAFRSWPMVRLLLWTITIAGMAVSVYALAQMVDLDPFTWSFGSGAPDRAFSSIGQPNALAAFLVLAIPIGAILLTESSGRVRWLLWMILALDVAAICLTFSRVGYVALVLVLIILLLPLARRLSRSEIILGGIAAALLIAAGLSGLLPDVAGRVGDRGASIADLGDVSTQKHFGMWLVAGRITLNNPLVGTGQETYPEMFTRYRADDLPGFGAAPARPESPHNNYLAISSSAGIPALGLYLALIGGVLLLLYRRRNSLANRIVLSALAAMFAGHMLTDAFMTAEIAGTWLFWLLMGVSVAMAGSGQKERSRASEESVGATA
jgi:O-antigen ligase